MSETVNTVKSFVKEVVARLTGDQSQAVAERNYRKAISAVSGQISALEGTLTDQETAVDDAKEALQNAKYPTTPIQTGPSGNSSYLHNIKRKQEELNAAQEAVEDTKESIKYYKALQEEFNS